MRLVTIEGLPKMCVDVLNTIHRTKVLPVVPSPMLPLSTSSQISAADDMCTVLSNIPVRLHMLRRIEVPDHALVCGGCHWIESPPIGVRGRAILHRLVQDLFRAIAEEHALHIEEHIVILLQTSVHECFEFLLGKMEGRDYTLHDLIEEKAFLETLTRVPGALSTFPYVVYSIPCPPFMRDNDHDVLFMARHIAKILGM